MLIYEDEGRTLVVEMVCPVTIKEETVGVVGPAAFGGKMKHRTEGASMG